MFPNWVLEIAVLAGPLLFSLTLHELAHARTALAFGDPTAKNMGRCTFNPLVHLDPIGTAALLFCGFGWAKPVPVNPNNLHPRRLGNIAVSLAGPLSNLTLAVLICLVIRLTLSLGVDLSGPFWDIVRTVAIGTVAVNLCLFMFNMIPLFPLDGHHILREQLSSDMQVRFMLWQMRYGRLVLMGLILGPRLTAALGMNVFNPIGFVYELALNLAVNHIILPT